MDLGLYGAPGVKSRPSTCKVFYLAAQSLQLQEIPGFYCFIFRVLGVCLFGFGFGTTIPEDTLGLLIAVHSEITPSGTWGTILAACY